MAIPITKNPEKTDDKPVWYKQPLVWAASKHPETQIGIGFSVVWFIVFFLALLLGWKSLAGLNEWGDFLAGFIGPAALTWLVVGYFQQQRELNLNTEVLRAQQLELKLTAKEQKRLADAANQQAELTILPTLWVSLSNDLGGPNGNGGNFKELTIENIGAPCGFLKNNSNLLRESHSTFNERPWRQGIEHSIFVTSENAQGGVLMLIFYDRLGYRVNCVIKVSCDSNGTPIRAVPTMTVREDSEPHIPYHQTTDMQNQPQKELQNQPQQQPAEEAR